jgi:hypothetical protein
MSKYIYLKNLVINKNSLNKIINILKVIFKNQKN